jgi:uncharacterized protein YndB with AHSA1/START domain
MVTISDTVDIQVPPSELWRWLCELPEHYRSWHPDHHGLEVVRGRLWEPGAVAEMREELHGKPHRVVLRVTEVTPEREIVYEGWSWLRGRFVLEPVNEHVRFTAELTFGPRGLPALVDRALAWLFRTRIAAAQTHQREEGANLKALLERTR